MSHHGVIVKWELGGAEFLAKRYSRAHTWSFDGGLVVPGSASPAVVKLPYSDAGAIDPEEAFVAAIASCHMLWFLDLAATRGCVVERYVDEASGVLGREGRGRYAITHVTLAPAVTFAGGVGPALTDELVEALHHEAHERCFIANSVRSEIVVQGSWTVA